MKSLFLALFFSIHIITECKNKDEEYKNFTKDEVSTNLLQSIQAASKNRISKNETIEQALFLLVILHLIKTSNIFTKEVQSFYEKNKQNNDFLNAVLLIKLAKIALLKNKFKNNEELEIGCRNQGMTNKLNFSYLVRKVTIDTPQKLTAIKTLRDKQQNTDFDKDEFGREINVLLKNSSYENIEIPLNSIFLDVTYIGEQKIPDEYNVTMSFLAQYGVFIYGKQDLPNYPGQYYYYILYGLKEPKNMTLNEFKKDQENILFYNYIINLLQKSRICIDGKKAIEILDIKLGNCLFNS